MRANHWSRVSPLVSQLARTVRSSYCIDMARFPSFIVTPDAPMITNHCSRVTRRQSVYSTYAGSHGHDDDSHGAECR